MFYSSQVGETLGLLFANTVVILTYIQYRAHLPQQQERSQCHVYDWDSR